MPSACIWRNGNKGNVMNRNIIRACLSQEQNQLAMSIGTFISVFRFNVPCLICGASQRNAFALAHEPCFAEVLVLEQSKCAK